MPAPCRRCARPGRGSVLKRLTSRGCSLYSLRLGGVYRCSKKNAPVPPEGGPPAGDKAARDEEPEEEEEEEDDAGAAVYLAAAVYTALIRH